MIVLSEPASPNSETEMASQHLPRTKESAPRSDVRDDEAEAAGEPRPAPEVEPVQPARAAYGPSDNAPLEAELLDDVASDQSDLFAAS